MEILKKPLLTEKITQLTEKLNRYAFKVDPRANKLQIKAAVEKMYGVNITAVNTMKLKDLNRLRPVPASELVLIIRTLQPMCPKRHL
jgi:ribosomal protein L23